jgi:hypothetical protein
LAQAWYEEGKARRWDVDILDGLRWFIREESMGGRQTRVGAKMIEGGREGHRMAEEDEEEI